MRKSVSANIFLLLLTLALFSCKKDGSPVGLDVQPQGDKLSGTFIDTFSVYTLTQKDDSTLTTGLSSNMIGSMYDPVFGKTSASLYTQFVIPNGLTAIDFGADRIFDSLVLVLPYYNGGYYGNIHTPQTVEVYQLLQDLPSGDVYSTRNFTSDTKIIGQITFIPKPKDSVSVGGKNQLAQVRIKLDDALGRSFLAQKPTDSLLSNTLFLNFFKGIYIKPNNSTQSSGDGALLSFDMRNPYAGATLYYKSDTAISKAQKTFTFSTGDVAIRVNHFDHDHSFADASITSQINKTDTTKGLNLTYIQALAGLRTRISFPFIQQLVANNQVVLNKAELVIKADPAGLISPDSLVPPVNVTLLGKDSLGKFYRIPDDIIEGAAYFGGTYNSSANEYRFTITRYVQAILKSKLKNPELYMYPLANSVYANRVVLAGGKNATTPVKLRLSYTKLN